MVSKRMPLCTEKQVHAAVYILTRKLQYTKVLSSSACYIMNQCLWSFTMEKVEVATAAKFSVELLNLSVKPQEKALQYTVYTILVLKHNIHTLYKVSRAHFQME